MLDEETWFTVQEAVEAGLVDEVTGGWYPIIPSQVMNAVGGGLPSAAELRAKKAAMENGSAPADDTPEEPGVQARLAASLSLKKYY